jgi:hypothetical protein
METFILLTYTLTDPSISSIRLRSGWYGSKWRTEWPCSAKRESVLNVLNRGLHSLIRQYNLGIWSLTGMSQCESQSITAHVWHEVGAGVSCTLWQTALSTTNTELCRRFGINFVLSHFYSYQNSFVMMISRFWPWFEHKQNVWSEAISLSACMMMADSLTNGVQIDLHLYRHPRHVFFFCEEWMFGLIHPCRW